MAPSHQYWLARESVRAIQRSMECGARVLVEEPARVKDVAAAPTGVRAAAPAPLPVRT